MQDKLLKSGKAGDDENDVSNLTLKLKNSLGKKSSSPKLKLSNKIFQSVLIPNSTMTADESKRISCHDIIRNLKYRKT